MSLDLSFENCETGATHEIIRENLHPAFVVCIVRVQGTSLFSRLTDTQRLIRRSVCRLWAILGLLPDGACRQRRRVVLRARSLDRGSA